MWAVCVLAGLCLHVSIVYGLLHFVDFLGKKVSPVVQSTSPVHRSSPPVQSTDCIQPNLFTNCTPCRSDSPVEDKTHFLFNCQLYVQMQEFKDVMDYCSTLNSAFAYLSNVDKWRFISAAMDNKLTSYIASLSQRLSNSEEQALTLRSLSYNCYVFS